LKLKSDNFKNVLTYNLSVSDVTSDSACALIIVLAQKNDTREVSNFCLTQI